jgi:hypothetical protein
MTGRKTLDHKRFNQDSQPKSALRIEPKNGADRLMNDIGASLPELSRLVERRLLLLRNLAESMESSSLALVRNDAEAIARGAAHQAELCRQWSRLEGELRLETGRRSSARSTGACGNSPQGEHFSRLQTEWESLEARIRYLVRVHRSLLRYLEHSLAVLHRVVDSCAPAYTLDAGLLRTEPWLRAAE